MWSGISYLFRPNSNPVGGKEPSFCDCISSTHHGHVEGAGYMLDTWMDFFPLYTFADPTYYITPWQDFGNK